VEGANAGGADDKAASSGFGDRASTAACRQSQVRTVCNSASSLSSTDRLMRGCADPPPPWDGGTSFTACDPFVVDSTGPNSSVTPRAFEVLRSRPPIQM